MKKMQKLLLALSLVAALFVVGCSEDDESTTVDPPNAPSNVSAVVFAPSIVRVTWTASPLVNAPESYHIYRRFTETTEWNLIAETGGDVTAHNDSTVDHGVSYEYRVSAHNEGGETFASGTATVTTATVNELLIGTWWDSDAFDTIGMDSVKFEFNSDDTFRRTEYYHTLDAEIWDQGTYSAGATEIEFHVTLTDTGATDTTYAWNFELNFDADEFDIEHDYNEGSPDWVHYIKSVPAGND